MWRAWHPPQPVFGQIRPSEGTPRRALKQHPSEEHVANAGTRAFIRAARRFPRIGGSSFGTLDGLSSMERSCPGSVVVNTISPAGACRTSPLPPNIGKAQSIPRLARRDADPLNPFDFEAAKLEESADNFNEAVGTVGLITGLRWLA